MKALLVMAAVFALTACDYTEVVRETGYKGKARVNPWLAAEHFAGRMGRDTRAVISWTAPGYDDALWVLPAAILSNESFTRRMEEWVHDGGHLVLLVEHADAETNDWSDYQAEPEFEPALFSMLERAEIELKVENPAGSSTKAEVIEFDEQTYKVNASSVATVEVGEGKPGVFASVESGDGRITVITDGRLLRNRWIAENEHADLFNALIEATDRGGMVGFMRGSGLSLWAMLKEHLWPVLLGLGIWVVIWLWKNVSRFGPLESAAPPPVLRGYEHHLEALGDFQWRLDRGAALLAPLRAQIVELGQSTSVRAGRRDEDFFQFLADRADLQRERVFRALAEEAPTDPAILTRTTADLQQLLKVLHHPTLS